MTTFFDAPDSITAFSCLFLPHPSLFVAPCEFCGSGVLIHCAPPPIEVYHLAEPPLGSRAGTRPLGKSMTDSTTPPPPPPPKETKDVADEQKNGGPEEEEDQEDVNMPLATSAAAGTAAPPATVAAVAVAAPAQTGGGKRSPSDFLKTVLGRPVVVKLNSGIDYRGERLVGAEDDRPPVGRACGLSAPT